jgi:hypothetical protein
MRITGFLFPSSLRIVTIFDDCRVGKTALAKIPPRPGFLNVFVLRF